MPVGTPDMSTQSTAAGGKMHPVDLYQTSSAPAAQPCAATGEITPVSSARTAALTLAHPMVPATKPFGEGGLAGEKKMSPLAIMGTKHNLLFARDHTVAQANDHVALWSASCLQTDDIPKAALGGRGATFSKL